MLVMDSMPSAALLVAQEQLRKRREALHVTQQSADDLPWVAEEPPRPTSAKPIVALPAHLGFHSMAVTAYLRASEKQAVTPKSKWTKDHLQVNSDPSEKQASEFSLDGRVRLYPDIAIALLKQGQTAVGRVWLLLRHIDQDGQGWVSIEQARHLLTQRGSPLRVVGWRRLRQILQAGQGIFWVRGESRIWLRSVSRIAESLGVARLSLQPVLLPLSALLSGIGDVNAHFYASFHSGRKSSMPISRETLERITGLAARQQREYESITGVHKQRNFAVGERHTAQNAQNRAWMQGGAVFCFIDHHGRQGPEKRRYIAWHLPNSYTGCHQHAPKGRMRKINRAIDLVTSQAQGNRAGRVFHTDGAKAAKAYDRQNGYKDAYWFSENGRQRCKGVWYVLPCQGE